MRSRHVFAHLPGRLDFERSLDFYSAVLAGIGLEVRFIDRTRPWAGWQIPGEPRPLFLIGKPFDENPHHCGNGQMVAFLANTRALVDSAYSLALAHGGTSDGAPGLRPRYHANYYGAYFCDPDGNKVCIARHTPLD